MRLIASHVRARPRLVGSLVTGIAVGFLMPASLGAVPRALLGWNVAVWIYLILVGWMMMHADHGKLQRVALAQTEGAGTVLVVVSVASVVSLMATVIEMSAALGADAWHSWPHLSLALATVLGSWLLLPTEFALRYASIYYGAAQGIGLRFPDADPHFKPDYGDFLYFSMTISVALQTADVIVTSQAMRRLVLLQSLLSFTFNTAILALTINVAAGLFGNHPLSIVPR